MAPVYVPKPPGSDTPRSNRRLRLCPPTTLNRRCSLSSCTTWTECGVLCRLAGHLRTYFWTGKKHKQVEVRGLAQRAPRSLNSFNAPIQLYRKRARVAENSNKSRRRAYRLTAAMTGCREPASAPQSAPTSPQPSKQRRKAAIELKRRDRDSETPLVQVQPSDPSFRVFYWCCRFITRGRG